MYTIMKSKSFSSLFIAGILLLIIFSVSECFAEDWGWKRGGCGNIYASQIIKKWDAKWFHYKTETCPLKVNAHDWDWRYLDEETGWQLIPTDWRDPNLTFFTGASLIDPTGDYTTWYRLNDGPTGVSGVTITYRTDDRTTMPSPVYPGESINDYGPIFRYRPMHAYEAVTHLNCTASVGSPSTTIHEFTGSDEDIFLCLCNPSSILYADDDGETKDFNRFGTATWILQSNPPSATLDSAGQLKTSIDADASGTLKAIVYDNDLDSGGISVSVQPFGGLGMSASVSINIPIGGDNEGSAGLGFAFSSDHLSDDTNDEIEASSGNYPSAELPKTITRTYSHNPSSVIFRGLQGSESKAKAIVSAEAYCEELAPFKMAFSGIDCDSSSGDGGVTYYVTVPTYDPGSGFVEHEDW